MKIISWEDCQMHEVDLGIEAEEIARAHKITSPRVRRFEEILKVAKTAEEFRYVAHNAPSGSEVQNNAFRRFVDLTSDLDVLWKLRERRTLLHHQRMHALNRYKIVFNSLVDQATEATIMELLCRLELLHDDLYRNRIKGLKKLAALAGMKYLDYIMANTEAGEAVRDEIIVVAAESRLALSA